MKYTHLKIFKLSLEFATYNEESVKHFDRYYKYTLGVDLRKLSKEILFSIHRINGAKESIDRKAQLEILLDICNQYSTLLLLSKETKALSSFKQFKELSHFIYNINNQALGWYNYTCASINKSSSC